MRSNPNKISTWNTDFIHPDKLFWNFYGLMGNPKFKQCFFWFGIQIDFCSEHPNASSESLITVVAEGRRAMFDSFQFDIWLQGCFAGFFGSFSVLIASYFVHLNFVPDLKNFSWKLKSMYVFMGTLWGGLAMSFVKQHILIGVAFGVGWMNVLDSFVAAAVIFTQAATKHLNSRKEF